MTEALEHSQDAVLADLEASKITEPSKGPLDFPAPPVAPQLATVLVQRLLVVAAIRDNQVDATSPQPPPQRVAVIAPVGNNPLGPHPRSSWAPTGHLHGSQSRFRQPHLTRRGRGEENSQRYTLAIGQYHSFRPLAALRFADRVAPFLAGKNVASRNVSSQRSRPRSSSAPSSARQARNQTPRSSQRRSRRQHVAGLGYCGGRSRHRAPLRSTQRMPSTQARLSTAGRPRRVLRLGSGNKFWIAVHCRSVSLMRQGLQHAAVKHKYLVLASIEF